MNSDDIFKEYALKVLAGKPGYSLERAEELFPNKAWLVRQYYLIYLSADVNTINQNLLKYINVVDYLYNDLWVAVNDLDKILVKMQNIRMKHQWAADADIWRIRELNVSNSFCVLMIDFLDTVKELETAGVFMYADELKQFLLKQGITDAESGIDGAMNLYKTILNQNVEEIKWLTQSTNFSKDNA